MYCGCGDAANASKTAPLFLSIVHLQDAPIGEYDFPVGIPGKSHSSSIFSGSERNGNLVSGLKGIPRPIISAHDPGTLAFDRPVHNFPFVVLHIHKNLAMRVGPNEFGHGAGNGNPVSLVISGVAVMREHGTANK